MVNVKWTFSWGKVRVKNVQRVDFCERHFGMKSKEVWFIHIKLKLYMTENRKHYERDRRDVNSESESRLHLTISFSSSFS